jgi:hypothetical protein
MDSTYLSTIAALAGSVIGGLTSLMASWLTQRTQLHTQLRVDDLGKRRELYKGFINEASKWYADAYEHDKPKVSNLVNLYALVATMRVVSPPNVVESADHVVRTIIETYSRPNRGFGDVREILDDESMNPLRGFSDVCREDLQGRI